MSSARAKGLNSSCVVTTGYLEGTYKYEKHLRRSNNCVNVKSKVCDV